MLNRFAPSQEEMQVTSTYAGQFWDLYNGSLTRKCETLDLLNAA